MGPRRAPLLSQSIRAEVIRDIVQNKADDFPGHPFLVIYPYTPFIFPPMGGNYLPEFKDKIPVFIVSIFAFCICGAFWDDRIHDFLLFFLIHKSAN